MKGVNKSINISKNNNLNEIKNSISDNVDKTYQIQIVWKIY